MNHEGLSRRELLRSGAVASAAVFTGGVLVGCGSDAKTSPTTSASTPQSSAAPTGSVVTPTGSVVSPTSAESAPDATGRGGTLRIGYGGPTSGETLYPLFPLTVVDVARAAALYDRLFVRQSDFSIQNELAEEMEAAADGLSYVVRIRAGVEFHNGKTVGADDLIFSFREWLDLKRSESGHGLSAIDGSRIDKLDDRTIRLNLTQPDYLIKENLIRYGTIVVPAEFDPANPVGCGPFKTKAFEPGVSSTFVRHENYWQTDRPYFDELVMTGFAEESARVNAILSGQVDVIDQISTAQVSQIESASNLKLLESQGGTVQPSMFVMNADSPPFNDPLVRQALRLVVDRQQLVDQVFGGRGRVGNDVWAPGDQNYADQLPQRATDLEKAKSLLQQAGQSNLNLELTVAEYNASVLPSAEVFAQQAGGAGVKITLKKITVNEWFDSYGKFPFVFDYWAAGSVAQQATFLLPGDGYDSSHWGVTVPEYADTYAAAKREADDAKRRELLQHIQQLHYDTGGLIMWGFPNALDAVSDKLGGLVASKSGLSLNGYLGFKEAYFVA